MRVAVDARSFRAAGSGRGIAVYLGQLLAALRALGGDDRYETVEDTRAKRVIAVSDAVRSEAISEWGLDPERVVTVRSGPGRPTGEPGSLPDGLDPGFVL